MRVRWCYKWWGGKQPRREKKRAYQQEPQGPWSLTWRMEAQLGHCSLASKEAGMSLGAMLEVEVDLRGSRMRRLWGKTPSMSRAWPTVMAANLVFHPAVQEEPAVLTRLIMSSERAGASSLAMRIGVAAHAAAMRVKTRETHMRRMLSRKC